MICEEAQSWGLTAKIKTIKTKNNSQAENFSLESATFLRENAFKWLQMDGAITKVTRSVSSLRLKMKMKGAGWGTSGALKARATVSCLLQTCHFFIFLPVKTHFPLPGSSQPTPGVSEPCWWMLSVLTPERHIGADLRRWGTRWCDQCCHNVAYHGLVMLHGSWRPSEESNLSFLNDYTSACSLSGNASSLLWIYRRTLGNYFNVSQVTRAISLWVYG